MSRYSPLLLLLYAGCSRPAAEPAASPLPAVVVPASPTLHFHTDLAVARKESAATGKPLCVFLVLGDWNRHC